MADSTGDDQQAQEPSLDDVINSAWDAAEQPEADTEQAQDSAETESTSESADESTPPETEAGGESEASDDAEEGTEGDEESQQAAATVEPPEDWSKDWQDRFGKLESDEARQLLIDQYKSFQADYTRKTQDLAEVRKAVEPLKEQLALHGMSEGQYIKQLTTADQYLSQNPVEAIQWLMQGYGVTPEHLGFAQRQADDSESDDEFADPQVSQLKQQVNQLQQHIQHNQLSQQQQVEQQLQAQVQTFAQQQNDDGKLAHPHFEDVKGHMAALLQTGAVEDLESAYDQAVWARPDLREQMLEAQKREAAQAAEKDRKAKAEKAKRAGTPASSGTTAQPQEEPGNLRDDLEKLFDQHTA